MTVVKYLIYFIILSLTTGEEIPSNTIENNIIDLDLSNVLDIILPGEFSILPDVDPPIEKEQVKYYLYTKDINKLQLNPYNLTAINYNNTKDTVFVVHGWRDGVNSPMAQVVKDAYLDSRDVIVVIVDWQEISQRSYFSAKDATPEVGKIISEFVRRMMETYNLNLNKTSFVGHSLGAHIAGFVGRELDNILNSITALDPAGVGYSPSTNLKLSKGDALFVQVIHTNKYILGSSISMGDADYYPNNGGPFQPGCNPLNRCSHDRSFYIYAESLLRGGFKAVQCSNSVQYSLGYCANGQTAYMGNAAIDRSTGDFYLDTNSEQPYSKTN